MWLLWSCVLNSNLEIKIYSFKTRMFYILIVTVNLKLNFNLFRNPFAWNFDEDFGCPTILFSRLRWSSFFNSKVLRYKMSYTTFVAALMKPIFHSFRSLCARNYDEDHELECPRLLLSRSWWNMIFSTRNSHELGF